MTRAAAVLAAAAAAAVAGAGTAASASRAAASRAAASRAAAGPWLLHTVAAAAAAVAAAAAARLWRRLWRSALAVGFGGRLCGGRLRCGLRRRLRRFDNLRAARVHEVSKGKATLRRAAHGISMWHSGGHARARVRIARTHLLP